MASEIPVVANEMGRSNSIFFRPALSKKVNETGHARILVSRSVVAPAKDWLIWHRILLYAVLDITVENLLGCITHYTGIDTCSEFSYDSLLRSRASSPSSTLESKQLV